MCELANLVHQKGDPYRTKRAELTYCQIAVFQAFGEAEKQPLFGPKSAVAKASSSSAQMTCRRCAEGRKRWSSRRVPSPFRVRIEQMLVAWVVIRNPPLKTVECRGPKFHAIQIAAQALERFDQVSHNRIFCRFRHCDALSLVPDVAASFRDKRRHAVLFPKTATARTVEMRFADRPASAPVGGYGQ